MCVMRGVCWCVVCVCWCVVCGEGLVCSVCVLVCNVYAGVPEFGGSWRPDC